MDPLVAPERLDKVWLVRSALGPAVHEAALEGVYGSAAAAQAHITEQGEWGEHFWTEEWTVATSPPAGLSGHARVWQELIDPDATVRALRRLLRTERSVSLVVLVGSHARGEAHPRSDVDLVVAGAEQRPLLDRRRLEGRLAHELQRGVDLIRLDGLATSMASLLLHAIDEGIVVTDRDGVWSHQRTLRDEVASMAADQERDTRRRIQDFLDELGVNARGVDRRAHRIRS